MFIYNVYLLDLERPEVPVARGVQAVPPAPQHCFLECRGFLGCPVAPVGPVDQGDQGGLEAVSSLLREKTRLKC